MQDTARFLGYTDALNGRSRVAVKAHFEMSYARGWRAGKREQGRRRLLEAQALTMPTSLDDFDF